MTTTTCQDHVHIVIYAGNREAELDDRDATIRMARELVGTERVHVVSARNTSIPGVRAENLLVEPIATGKSPAIALAGCHLYRRDPNIVMVYVDSLAKDAAMQLRQDFERIVDEAESPGCLVSLLDDSETCSHIYAWSIYALMECYRNFLPLDFQVINEIAKVWFRAPQRVEELYSRLAKENVAESLLARIKPGYYVRNVQIMRSSDHGGATFLGAESLIDDSIPSSEDD